MIPYKDTRRFYGLCGIIKASSQLPMADTKDGHSMTITVNGITLYYEVQGQGQPLIMIHGNGEDHTIFA